MDANPSVTVKHGQCRWRRLLKIGKMSGDSLIYQNANY